MKRIFTTTIYEPLSNDATVFHKESQVVIATSPTFEANTVKVNDTLTQNDEKTLNILSHTSTLDFPTEDVVYYLKTKTTLSNGESDGFSNVSLLTKTGGATAFQFSDTILVPPTLTQTGPSEFKTNDFRVYTGNGEHTHTSWRLVDEGGVVWERPKDNFNLKSIVIPDEYIGNSAYTLEACFHAGNIQSVWGAILIVRHDPSTDIGVDFPIVENGIIQLTKDVDNYFKITTRRTDFISAEWTITDLSGSVLTKSSFVTTVALGAEVQRDPLGFRITPMSLPTNRPLSLMIKVTFSGSVVTKSFELNVQEHIDLFKHLKDKGINLNVSTSLPTTSPTTGKGNTLRINSNVFFIENKEVKKFQAVGNSYVPRPLGLTIKFDDMIDAKGYDIKIINNLLLIQVTEEEEVNGNFVYRRVVYVYNYDTNNDLIIPFAQPRRKVLSENLTDTITDYSFAINSLNELVYVAKENNADGILSYVSKRLQLSDLVVVAGVQLSTVTLMGSSKTPVVFNASLYELVFAGIEKTIYINEKNNTPIEIAGKLSDLVNKDYWIDIINRSNGSVMLLGVSINNVETLSVATFNYLAMSFANSQIIQLPKDAEDNAITSKPTSLTTNKNNAILLYDGTSIGIS